MFHDPVQVRVTVRFLQNTLPDQEERPWYEAAVVVDSRLVSHQGAFGRAGGSWCEWCCVREALVVDL